MRTRVQLYLDEDDLACLERWSQERRCSKSEAVRIAVRLLTRETSADALLGLEGCIVAKLPSDSSENVDRYLNATYAAKTAPPYRRG